MSNTKRGFTLIELLVVIAIIGVLASVVLASLNTARNKGADAAVKANLNGIRAQAELSYDTASNYDSVCADANVTSALTAAKAAGGNGAAGAAGDGECNDSTTAYAVWTNLKTSGAWCVDNTGASKAVATAQNSGSSALTACP